MEVVFVDKRIRYTSILTLIGMSGITYECYMQGDLVGATVAGILSLSLIGLLTHSVYELIKSRPRSRS